MSRVCHRVFCCVSLGMLMLLLVACSGTDVSQSDPDPDGDAETPDGDLDDDLTDGDDPDPIPCTRHADCPPETYCDPCGASSCPECDNCLSVCLPHDCPSEAVPVCDMTRPECAGPVDAVSVVEDGCWQCVDRETCGERFRHDPVCDDGTALVCDWATPVCESHEILAFQKSCYACVDPQTCGPALRPCEDDADCDVADWCDPCAAPSCVGCDDCTARCVPHECVTQPEPTCDQARPDCGEEGVAVVRDGCWVCLIPLTCLPVPTRPTHCDDGTEPSCEMTPPACAAHEILAYQDDCYVCVNAISCKPWGEPGCAVDADCPPAAWCDPCATAPCPTCPTCAPACMAHGCETEADLLCDGLRPDCPPRQFAVIRDGCWVCLHQDTCEVADRDTHCDDETEPTCEMLPPACSNDEILAFQNDCYRCVNPLTCKPWGEAGCETDMGCPPTHACEMCGTSSCPGCLDCVYACLPHGCQTEDTLGCWLARPDCGQNGVAVIRDACWVCVDTTTCEPIRDRRCDDGTEPSCNRIPPVCTEHEILAHQDGCYACVNPVSCRPWGEPGCLTDADCRPTRYCNDCATSSCPACDDCSSACVLHGCPTQNTVTCDEPRPECGNDDSVAVVKSGCWECVDRETCE